MSAEKLEHIEEWKIEALDLLEAFAAGYEDASPLPAEGDLHGGVYQALEDLRAALIGYAERTHKINRLPLSEITKMVDLIKQRHDR